MKRLAITIGGIATVAVVGIALLLADGNEVHGDGPKLVGQMQNFIIKETHSQRPETSWQDANGRTFTFANFDGKVVLFNYWASWCAPCQRELPGIDRLQARLGGDNFEVVALNIDRGGRPIAERNARRLRLKNLKLYLDPNIRTGRALGLQGMPTTIVFDRKGRELGRLVGGAEWDTPEAVELLNYFIDRPDYVERLSQANRL